MGAPYGSSTNNANAKFMHANFFEEMMRVKR